MFPNQTIVIRGERIEKVGPQSDLSSIPEGVRVPT